jgi:hypothetical protein
LLVVLRVEWYTLHKEALLIIEKTVRMTTIYEEANYIEPLGA